MYTFKYGFNKKNISINIQGNGENSFSFVRPEDCI